MRWSLKINTQLYRRAQRLASLSQTIGLPIGLQEYLLQFESCRQSAIASTV